MRNFKQTGLGTGHGAYLIAYDGYSFSHISEEKNAK